MGTFFKSYLSDKFDWPETLCEFGRSSCPEALRKLFWALWKEFFQWGGTCPFVRYFIYYFPASEKRAFLLYYATPLLSRYLPSDHHLFLMLLTGGMFRLLKQSISQEELHEAHTYLRLFTAQAPFFFGKHYNV